MPKKFEIRSSTAEFLICEIRLSERRFYQKLTDIYATSMDYNKDAPTTRLFYKRIQNKMHYVMHQHTAAELEDMGHIVTAELDFAESRAKRHIPMTMEDWAKRFFGKYLGELPFEEKDWYMFWRCDDTIYFNLFQTFC